MKRTSLPLPRKRTRRREFMGLLGGAIAAPLVARAQGERIRRIGVLARGTEADVVQKQNFNALRDGLAKLNWVEGRNLRIELRNASDGDQIRTAAAELVSLAPEVIVSSPTEATRAVQQLTKTIPIVFAAGGDPVLTGIVENIARPEANTTGFGVYEPSIGGKWLELLKEAVPRVSEVALLFDADLASSVAATYISSIEAAGQALGVQTTKMPFHDGVDIVRSIDAFAAAPNRGLLLLPPPANGSTRNMIIRLANEHRLPAIHPQHSVGGLMSYAPNIVDNYFRAASYVDRLLRGAKISDLPVQFPTKFELVINLKAAKAIGLMIPEAFLLRADEVIE